MAKKLTKEELFGEETENIKVIGDDEFDDHPFTKPKITGIRIDGKPNKPKN